MLLLSEEILWKGTTARQLRTACSKRLAQGLATAEKIKSCSINLLLEKASRTCPHRSLQLQPKTLRMLS